MNFKLCAFDLDGTLLDPEGALAPEARACLAKLRLRMRVTLATGRSLASAWPYIQDLGIREPVVLYHGAVVFCPQTQKILYEARLSPVAARAALQLAKEFPVDVQLYRAVRDPRIYVGSCSATVLGFAQKEKLPVAVRSDLGALAAEGPLKLLFISSDERVLAELRAALEGVEATVVRSAPDYLEVLPPGVSKGAGLAWICTKLGIPLAEVVAVGDQESDLSMFALVGLGVAMAHAPPEVVSQADRVVRDVAELCMFL